MSQKITLRDVASHAGVSVTTVSNVVRNWRYISDETRQKVQDSIRELGYSPNLIAQGLRTGRSQQIGFITPDLINPHFTSMISTVEDVAQEHGYSVLLFNTHSSQIREAERIQGALSTSVDGLLVVPTADWSQTLNLLHNAPMPIVFLDRIPDEFDAPYCKVHNFQMVQLLMKHLYDLGHRQIALLTGPSNVTTSTERITSYWHFVESYNLSYRHATANSGSWGSEEGYRAVAMLLDTQSPPPTAILATNDTMAIGASHAIRERGLRIPEDISLVGIDDIEVSRYMNPALTTVQQPLSEMAEVSVGMLLDLLQKKSPSDTRVSLLPKLIIRNSTSAPGKQPMSDYLLQMEHIHKSFPGVNALADVSLAVQTGEVHALLGENGAGKSTLMKILSGVYRPDSGTIRLNGRPVHITSPQHAQRLGIVTIYQEFNLIPSLTIAENIFIGREPGVASLVNWGQMYQQAENFIQRLGMNLDPRARVRNLSVAEQQMVEIARALSMKSQLIVMDEPTSALSEHEVSQLFRVIQELKAQGISVIFITHHLEEAQKICDRLTVLRDGQLVGSEAMSDVSLDDIIRMMVGRSASELFQRSAAHQYGEVALRVTGLNRPRDPRDPNAIALHEISFEVRYGEILGLAGLVGAGRTELARAIFGADKINKGNLEIAGRTVRIRSPQAAIRHGLGLVPEDRKQQALFLAMAVRENLSMASLGKMLWLGSVVKNGMEQALMQRYRDALNIRMASSEQRIINLSGGNQQKVVIARWLALEPKVLILDEPTRGIDIAAKAEVHQLMDDLASRGIAIIMISSELPEILGMSDRILTLREGRITGEFLRGAATEENLMQAMTLAERQ